MNLAELQEVLSETRMAIMLFTNRLRWGEVLSELQALEERLKLAEFVIMQADLKDHVNALKRVLRICDAVAKDRYLEDCQRCHLLEEARCEHACTTDEDCDAFDDRDPHTAILEWLEDLRPLGPIVQAWVRAQLPVQQKLREGLREFFPDLKTYKIGETADGQKVMAEMTDLDRQFSDAEEDAARAAMAGSVDQYPLNLERIRHICQEKGDLAEVAIIIRAGSRQGA
jgi:hypothetical protein